jgi:hypothetical protein
LIEGAANKFGSDRLDSVVDGDLQDVGGAGGGEKQEHGKAAGGMVKPASPWLWTVAGLGRAWTGEGARPWTNIAGK